MLHLAGVLRDALLPDVDVAAMAQTAAGKSLGAWHLHELTRDQPIEFFVLFSSLAGLIGSPGQAAYAAANTFLDALARHRAALGLPGQSLAWGPWAGVSLAAADGETDRLAARGLPPLDPATGIGLLEEAMRCGAPQLAVSAFASAELGGAAAWPAARQLLAPLLAPATGGVAGGTGPARPGALRAELLALASDADRRHTLRVFVTEQIRQVLGARATVIQPDVPFQTLGFDSLMAIELRGRLEPALATRLSATLVYAHPTIDELTDRLLLSLLPSDPRNPPPARQPAAVDQTPPDDLAGELAALDDAGVTALLAAELDTFDSSDVPDIPAPPDIPAVPDPHGQEEE